jgi:ABC-2 type transport system ATP-binding protein
MGNLAVETVGLCKKFTPPRGLKEFLTGAPIREILAVDNISLCVKEKEVFGLVGPNGAGKTTLFNLFCTIVIPTAGSARVGGYDVVASAPHVRRTIGLVTSNERSFYWRLTGRQNLSFFADLYGLPQKNIEKWIEELFDVLDLRSYADRRFDSYSTGMKQRLAMARALLHKPRIIFMDEPTKGLDPTASASLVRLIRERIVAAWGPTVIVSSHNLREIEQLCSRIAIMHSGKMLCCGGLNELCRQLYPYETYQLTVGNVSKPLAENIGKLQGVMSISDLHDDGSIDLEVRLTGEDGVLSDVLRTVLMNGGEVYHCSALPVSLEDVFSHYSSKAAKGF